MPDADADADVDADRDVLLTLIVLLANKSGGGCSDIACSSLNVFEGVAMSWLSKQSGECKVER